MLQTENIEYLFLKLLICECRMLIEKLPPLNQQSAIDNQQFPMSPSFSYMTPRPAMRLGYLFWFLNSATFDPGTSTILWSFDFFFFLFAVAAQ